MTTATKTRITINNIYSSIDQKDYNYATGHCTEDGNCLLKPVDVGLMKQDNDAQFIWAQVGYTWNVEFMDLISIEMFD